MESIHKEYKEQFSFNLIKKLIVIIFCLCFFNRGIGQGIAVGTVSSFYSELSCTSPVKSIKINPTETLLVKIDTEETISGSVVYTGEVKQCEGARVYFIFQNLKFTGKIIDTCTNKVYDYSSDDNQVVYVTETKQERVICTEFPTGVITEKQRRESTPAPTPSSDVYNLQSLPGATAVVMLDFDGYSASSAWGNITAAPAPVSEAEIFEAWSLISDDYRPFELNITTNEEIYQAAPSNRRMRCIFTPTDRALPGSGGVALIGTFTGGGDIFPCWVFNVFYGGKILGETGSHEIGHTLGLDHDGRNLPGGVTEIYYGGNGVFAPIMGISFDPPVSHWRKGEYPFANNRFQDDIEIIATQNGFGFRDDREGTSFSSAVPLAIESDGTVSPNSNSGVIHNQSDMDYFSFTTGEGNINLTVRPAEIWPNLDPIITLLDQRGNTIAISDPPLIQPAEINVSVAPGTYTLKIDGTGFGDPFVNGYTDYSSVGIYFISGTVAEPGTGSGSFTLVNAETDEDISPIEDGEIIPVQLTDHINIRFNPPAHTESVRFILNGAVERVENAEPYALAGDENGHYFSWEDAEPGVYELTAIPFSANNAKGTAGTPSSVRFTIIDSPAITGFTLVNANTDKDIKTLNNGDKIFRGQLPTLNLNIRINVSDLQEIARVEIKMDQSFMRTENSPPFAVFGDLNGNYEAGNLGLGTHVLTATPILKNGMRVTPRTITFEVLAGNPPSKIAYSPFFDSSATVLCYPNPSGSVFYFDIAAQNSQKIELLIYDSNSNEVAKIMHSTNPGEKTTLFWDASHLKNGIYFYKYFLSDDVVSGKLILFR